MEYLIIVEVDVIEPIDEHSIIGGPVMCILIRLVAYHLHNYGPRILTFAREVTGTYSSFAREVTGSRDYHEAHGIPYILAYLA
jgi:hypothetical protein